MKYRCNLQTNPVMINRACDKLVAAVSAIKPAAPPQTPRLQLAVSNSNQNSIKPPPQKPSPPPAQSSTVQGSANRRLTPDEKFFSDFEEGKLKDEEVLLIHYASETGRFSLGVGWRTDEERKRIAEWEELNQYSDTLSKKYESALSRLEVRNLTSVSERTSHGNPRQVDFVDGLKERMLDLPDSLHERALEIIQRDLETKDKADENPFPF
ncbi:hypothetical protein RGQ15_10375 [Paracoccus sp. MBLB3053]|uniref:Uncharacterized protein n=1 Tax=Paracoccus aurantius TaxID=3073814 RepID=A0ABU2HTW4_9RHOB|nr:hypothetical protein [Paracoccus sp. MBLB3053]MDS9467970.1 hypothetical protein [Paracoccus sp. MBLB3053]